MRLIAGLIVIFTLFSAMYQPISAQGEVVFEEVTLEHDGLERRYLLYVPSQLDVSQPAPLVFVLHGGGGNPELYEEVTGFSQKAEEGGFILVYPAGTGRTRLLTWNAGHCCAYALENDVDDVGFFRAMLEDIQADYNIDPNRIFAAGHSNGGMMTYRLAAELSDVFAAVAVVAGTIGGFPSLDGEPVIIPEPEYPVSVLHIHGQEDNNVQFDGGINTDGVSAERYDMSVMDSVGFWVEANACDPVGNLSLDESGFVAHVSYDCSETNTAVEIIAITDGGHSWPGGVAPIRRSDPPSERVDATAEIWAFFAAHPRE